MPTLPTLEFVDGNLCCVAAPVKAAGMSLPLPALNDEEGAQLPLSLAPVVDAHVHLFPDGVFEAIWRWFDTHGWPIRYKLHTPKVLDFLFTRGVSRFVALHYAHKPGMARALNEYVAAVQRSDARVDFAQLAGQHQVQSIQTMVVFKGGKEVDRIIGLTQEAALTERLLKLAK